MATTEHIGLLTHIDENGNKDLLYPVTKTSAIVADEALSMEGFQIKNVAAPMESGDAVNQAYVNANFLPYTWRPSATDIANAVAEIALTSIYPVGYIYMSMVYQSPAGILGGTWELLKDRFLLGAGDVYAIGATGGAATHTLTEYEFPPHVHTISGAGNVYIAAGETNMWINKPAENTGYSTSTSVVGGGGAHNNMPPYLVVYMWKRIA